EGPPVGGRGRAGARRRADRPRRRLRQLHPRAAADRPRRGRPGTPAAALRRVPGKRVLLPGGGLMSTVAWITARGLFGRRRFLLLFPLPILLVGLAVLSRGFGVNAQEWAWPVLGGLGFAVLLPVTALIVGTGVLGAEIDDGTVVHILAKPLPRWRIV